MLAIGFAIAQLVPGISMIETMSAESYLLLAIWCLLGFAFYWRTMSIDIEQKQGNESTTIAALFFLLIFSALIWYIKKNSAVTTVAQLEAATLGNSALLLTVVLLGLLVMLLIHSQLRRRQIRLETEKIRAIENSQAKSRFLFNMSHDIRTPMNAIIGYVSLARKAQDPEAVQDYLKKIDLSSQSLLTLINDILEMSRIESGRLELEEAPVDLCGAFDEIRDLFSEQMRQKDIAFEVDSDDLAHRWAWCDRRYLNRILLNLLSNAYKFTPEGGAVTVSLREQGEAGDGRVRYELQVIDSGIGMSEEFADRMFNAFEREHTSTDSGVEGTGLGLAITRSIVDLMGGSIRVENAPGSGTEFIVALDLRPAEAEELPAEAPSAAPVDEPPEENPVDFAGKRLLLVEDNAINMEIACMILTQMGFILETVENGRIAVDMVAASQPGWYDAILMDIQMPVMDGYTATRAIRGLEDERLAKIPIVAMTANAFQEDVRAAHDAGMQGHIAKPIDVNVMIQTLSEVLARDNGS